MFAILQLNFLFYDIITNKTLGGENCVNYISAFQLFAK